MTGGLFVMVLTATAIISNATFLQSVRHPEPLLATRPPLVVDRNAPLPPPLPPHRDEIGSIPPPLPRPAPIAAVTTTRPADDTLVRDIQTALAGRELYLGAIDGEYGPLSRSAITAYQEAQGLSVTGEPSVALLEHLMTSGDPPQPAKTVNASRSETPILPAVEATVADSQRLRYERVQAALNRIGYGSIAVDGVANGETVSAIRRFELDNGLPISGTASDAVIDRLIAIGALPAT
jgi:peptidoglycan hydrolase-like protein with peptidoglycan-binding domain